MRSTLEALKQALTAGELFCRRVNNTEMRSKESYNDFVASNAVLREAIKREEAQTVEPVEPVAVPQGWKLMPVEPTAVILDAMAASQAKHGSAEKFMPLERLINLGAHKVREVLSEAYRVAIAAAPQPPQAERVPMTEREILDLSQCYADRPTFARAIERHHGIGVKP